MKMSNKMLDVDIATFLGREYKLSYLSNSYNRGNNNSIFKFDKRWVPRVIYLPLINKHNRIIKLRFE